MRELLDFSPFLRLCQHTFREINSNDAAMAGIHGKGNAGSHTDFKDMFTRLDIQIANG